jgi:hypothetical protein
METQCDTRTRTLSKRVRAQVPTSQARGARLVTATAPPVRAADGCLVMLCLAAPNWRVIGQCVDPVRSVLRDLARGRPFPSCPMAGAGNRASHRWSSAPGDCPPQYTVEVPLESGTRYDCLFAGAIALTIDGALWSTTWWNLGGDTATDFGLAARGQLGSWDSRFDDDLAAWRAVTPTPAPCGTC